MDGVAIAITLGFCVFNFHKIVIKLKVRQVFIWLFYVLAFICLSCWEVTSIAQTVKPETRYLVF